MLSKSVAVAPHRTYAKNGTVADSTTYAKDGTWLSGHDACASFAPDDELQGSFAASMIACCRLLLLDTSRSMFMFFSSLPLLCDEVLSMEARLRVCLVFRIVSFGPRSSNFSTNL